MLPLPFAGKVPLTLTLSRGGERGKYASPLAGEAGGAEGAAG
jgi:hypothetical protein